jgi:hypothetical protein
MKTYSHCTEECKVIQNQIKCMCGTWEAARSCKTKHNQLQAKKLIKYTQKKP